MIHNNPPIPLLLTGLLLSATAPSMVTPNKYTNYILKQTCFTSYRNIYHIEPSPLYGRFIVISNNWGEKRWGQSEATLQTGRRNQKGLISAEAKKLTL